MTELEFHALAKEGYNRIPLIAESFADLDTPLSLYLKLARSRGSSANSFLLESVVGGERFGRYSFIGVPARTVLRARIDGGEGGRHRTEVVTDGRVVEQDHGDPLAFIERYSSRFKVALRPGLPRFCGGLAGYFGYDTVRLIEKRLARAKHDDLDLPDIQLLLTEELAVIDNLSGRAYLIVYADASQPEGYSRARERLRDLRADLARHVEPPHTRASVRRPEQREFAQAPITSPRCAAPRSTSRRAMCSRSRSASASASSSPMRRCRCIARCARSIRRPYMYYYDFGDAQVVGASPEILVRSESATGRALVAIRPLAGTRPRGASPEQDAALAAELLADPKERAEHLMLIDLARNDIGRIARTGTVQGDRADGDRALFARDAPGQPRRRRAAAWHEQFRRAARHLSGRHAVGHAQGARDGRSSTSSSRSSAASTAAPSGT